MSYVLRYVMRLGVIALMLPHAHSALALCTEESRRYLAGEPSTVVFQAGAAATQFVPVIYFIAPAGSSESECGVLATTTLPGVTMVENYCNWSLVGGGTNCIVGNSVGVDSDSAIPSTGTHGFRWYEAEVDNFGNIAGHLRRIEVRYDGTAPAGTSGFIDLNELDANSTPAHLLGRIPVKIVGSPVASDWFTATSTAQNISGSSFTIDNALINGNSNSRLFITHVHNGTYWPHQTAVWYDAAVGKWKIRNEDNTSMPVGLTFFVHVDPTAIVVRSSATSANYIIIDNPISNNNPYASVLVTQHTTGTRRSTQPVFVAYVAPYWEIATSNGSPFPTSGDAGARWTPPGRRDERPGKGDWTAPGGNVNFFVKILGAAHYVDDAVGGDSSVYGAADHAGYGTFNGVNGAGMDIRALPPRRSADYKVLSKFCFTSSGASVYGTPIIITKNQTPMNAYGSAMYTNEFWGVWRVGDAVNGYTSTIYNEGGLAMADIVGFNVWGPPQPTCTPPQP